MLTVVTTATSDMLVSLADAKEAMDITDAGYDEKLTRTIRRASARIETYVGRPLLVQKYQAALPSYGGPILQLPLHPVRNVFRVFDGTDTGTGTELSSTEYTLDKSRGQLVRNAGWPWTYTSYSEVAPFPEPGKEYARWLVEFSAGYIPANGTSTTWDGTNTTGTTVPLDIQEAAISLTRSTWYSRTRESNITSKSVGELSISYGKQSGALPDEVMSILNPYRSIL